MSVNTDPEIRILVETQPIILPSKQSEATVDYINAHSDLDDDFAEIVQINNYFDQTKDNDDISVISDSDSEFYFDTTDINSCNGDNDSSVGNLDDFAFSQYGCTDNFQQNDDSLNVIATIKTNNNDENIEPDKLDSLEQHNQHNNQFNILIIRNTILLILKTIAVSCIRELTTTTAATHTIRVQEGIAPIKLRQRQIPCKYQAELEQMLSDMLAAGIIQKSSSPWAFPLRLVKKKDGKLRITVDYQKLNNITERPAYPIPYISDIFTKLSKARFYTVIDLTSGYYQVPLDPKSRQFTAFRYGDSQYEYLRMPMGITGAVETFQKMMNEALEGLLHTICEVYLDDIIIYSQTLEEHSEHVRVVAERLRHYNFKIKIEKCQIAMEKIEFLGHEVSNGTIAPNQKKVMDLFKYTTPLNAKQIHSFIGLGTYYKKFIKNFSAIVKPLIDALKQKTILWTVECENAVNTIRTHLTNQPILILPDITQPFRVETDASGYGVGAVLTQEREIDWLPVAYFSKGLTLAQQRYCTAERELLAIVLAIEYFQYYLYGEKFVVITDHKPLKHLLKSKDPASRLIRWRWRLSRFDFTIQYREGTKNGNADALSRLPTELISEESSSDSYVINVVVAPTQPANSKQMADIDLKWLYDLKLQARVENKQFFTITDFDNQERRSLYNQWSRIKIINDTLYRGYTVKGQNDAKILFQYIVPKQQRAEILELAHDISLSGHLGAEKTIERIRERFYWPNWEAQTKEYVLSCQICQQTKLLRFNNAAQLRPILSNKPLEIVTMDLAGPLPKSLKQNSYVLVMCDHFTKWAQIYPMRKIQASDVAKRVVSFVCQLGLPEHILTDRGTNFQATMMQELYDMLDVHGLRTSSYHPETDGLSERFIQTLKTMIKAYTNEKKNQRDWDEKLSLLQFAYNTACHSTTKYSPYYLMYGRTPKIPLDFISPTVELVVPQNMDSYVESMVTNLKSVFKIVVKNRNFRMNKAKIRHDRKIRAKRYNVGDHVWITNEQTKIGENPSIKKPFIGPYRVTEVLNDNNYKIKRLNRNSKVKIMNRRRMKKCFMRPDYLSNQKNLNSLTPVESSNNENSTADEWIYDHTTTSEEEIMLADTNVIKPTPNNDLADHKDIETIITRTSSDDSINNVYNENKHQRPKRNCKRPDYYNSALINQRIRLTNQQSNHNDQNANSKISIKNGTERYDSELESMKLQRLTRKKKPPDKLE